MSRVARIIPVVAVCALLSGCAPPTGDLTGQVSPTAEVDGPITVDNCGTAVEFAAPPQRVVTIKSSTTEMLLALGLGGRIVGTAFQDGPVPDRWAGDAVGLRMLADKVPSQEVVLEVEPDLVYGGWESNFSPDGAGERADLAALGINSYVSPSACQSHGQPDKLTFEHIFDDIEEVAAIFRVDASELIASQREALESLGPIGQDLPALWFSSGSDTPFVGAGIGAPQLIMDSIGLDNIASSIRATWAPFNWEAVVDADPYVIVLVDAAWNSAEKKIGVLESNPATANLSAVQAGRYLVIPFAASEAGVRTVEAAVDLMGQLDALDSP